jgi:glycosyltransferase involved in cell wall biosynthesis
MRILFISAFYPPHIVGGWEQLVHDINHRLQDRGHVTRVLTSVHGVDAPHDSGDVARLLTLESDLYHYQPRHFWGRKDRLQRNLQITRQTIQDFQPDIIFVHVMWNLNRGIAWVAEQMCPGRVVYYIANNWPYALDPHTAYLRSPARNRWRSTLKQVATFVPLKIVQRDNQAFPLKFEHVLCVSQAMKDDLARNAGIAIENMHVVYNGVETDLFTPRPSRFVKPRNPMQLSLLYAGSLVSHKGVHTAIEAIDILKQQAALGTITLTIVGSGHPDYEASLRRFVDTARLHDHVKFRGRIPREEMPALLQHYDVLIFPSTWEEPLARTMQEAMAAGLVVVGTLTGGSGELLVENETGLTFAAGDAAMLAQRIVQLYENPELLPYLAQNGRTRVLEQFSLDRMIDEIESYFSQVIPAKSAVHGIGV